MQYILCAIYVILTISGLTFMKMGSMAENLKGIVIPVVDMRITAISLVGYLCYGMSFLLYTVIISKFDLGFITPMLNGVVNVSILVVAFLVFKEHFTLNSAIGAVLIIAGVIVMNIK